MTETCDWSRKIYTFHETIRKDRPLIHVVTNFVVMNQTANALLALGASPTMSWAREDMANMSGISDALCVNIGTPVTDRVGIMKDLMAMAQDQSKPVVLDPVGAGAGPYRTRIAHELAAVCPNKIIRGNASEICSLAGGRAAPRGVESTMPRDEARQILIQHGRKGDKVRAEGVSDLLNSASALAVSGVEDMVLGRERCAVIANGSQLMGAVTGTGCILSALTAAFFAVARDGFEAAVAALAVAGIAGEVAAEVCRGPGFFMNHFLDALYNMDEKTIAGRLRADIRETGPCDTEPGR